MTPDHEFEPVVLEQEELAVERLLGKLRGFDDEAAHAEPPGDTSGVRSGATELAGRHLLPRLRPFNGKRVETLMRYELTGGMSDYGFLMAPLCVVVESELVRVLGEPARAVRDELVRVLAVEDEHPAAELAGWKAGRHATFGTVCLAVLGMRRAAEQGYATPAGERVGRFVQALPGEYREAVVQKAYGACLNRLRERRNQLAHRDDPFDRRDYHAVVRWALCQEQLRDWHREGPSLRPVLPWGVGVLHRHLLCVPHAPAHAPAPTDATAELFAVRPAGGGVRLTVRAAAVVAERARLVARPTDPDTFPIGARVECEVSVDSPATGHLLLLNRDVSGGVRVLASATVPAGGRFVFPTTPPDLRLTDGPGEEWFKVIVSDRPLVPRADANAELTTEEVSELVGRSGGGREATARVTVTA